MKLPETFAAVVTGGGSGLGRALTLELARRGGRVVVADVSRAGAEETVELVRRAGGRAFFVPCDVSVWEEVDALAEKSRELVGEVDLVANNAGVAAGGFVGEVSLADWRFTVDVNLWGVVHGCHAFVPAMRARGRGWVLNVASAAGFACLPRFSPYNVTKAGVIALSQTLRAELDPRKVAVTVACPTFFPTKIVEAARGDDPETRSLVAELMRRSGLTAADVARHAIASLEAGSLYSLPSADARAVRWASAVVPGWLHHLTRVAESLARRALRPSQPS